MTDLRQLNLSRPVTLGIGWRDQGTIDGGRIEISNPIAEHFREIAFNHWQDLISRSRRPFSPEADLEPGEEYLVANVAELDEDEPITDLLDEIELRDPRSINDLPKRSLLFYAFVFPQQAAFLRKLNPHQTATPGKVWTRLENTLERILDPVFAFDRRVDLVITTEEILITNVKAFELLFKEEDYFLRHIDEWVNAISDHLPLTADSRELLVNRCRTSTRLRRRLESIHRRGHLTDVTMSAVQEQAENHDLSPNLIQNSELNLRGVSLDNVLKLLNEDLFTGDFSSVRFAVDRKSPR